MTPSLQKYLHRLLTGELGFSVSAMQLHPVGGGSINSAYQVMINHHTCFFLKLNSIRKYPMLFLREKEGLEFLSRQKLLRVPSVVACSETEDSQILLLEWVESGARTENFWKQFGEQLAGLHHVTNAYFGFGTDNYMGALPQPNNHHNNWNTFFVQRRLQPQIKLAAERQLLTSRHVSMFENLYPRLWDIFEEEVPSLLHGDLWSGNYLCDRQSQPVLIDPAVYFGHRSADLAMTTLFGGFDKVFYEAYHYHFPFPSRYHEQWEICNLYPLLVHLNLFGPGYLGQIESTLRNFR